MSEQQGLFVGLIPDGNRRWAGKQGVSVIEGHEAGAERVKKIFERARDETIIRIIAAWGLSCKNLEKRPPDQLEGLYALIESTLVDLRDHWMDRPENKNVRMVHMGRRDRLKENVGGREVLSRLDEIAMHTRDRTGMIIALCLDYDGNNERKRAIEMWRACGALGDGDDFLQYLDLPRQRIPFQRVDLVIRTGEDGMDENGDGHHHNNEFLHEYRDDTEDAPHKILLPDYTPDHFSADLRNFLRTKRRKGA